VILSDKDIAWEIQRRKLRVGNIHGDLGNKQPMHAQIQPASVDMRLGTSFKVYDKNLTTAIDPREGINCMRDIEIEADTPFVLHPGDFVLGATQEFVEIPFDLVAQVTGRSSIGRLGVIVHATAGLIDPGFKGCITLELSNLSPLAVKIWPGMRIAQLVISRLSSPAMWPYDGKYQGDTSVAASRIAEDKDY